ncbi:S-layer homology domain-containing protein [Pseudoflavonifractor sp. MSJ-37]|uniref:S-layer homology domain-containing protein n=1 Tax=Pseudoflavonifractor sp. MSJ-37 TaxID=2841531 RepID=UPI001C10D294|nr:S-layer homology domain-containing protein [Pseudoflavonifractor sp. MSJ-37]MBU5435525.1 S-layer homology domain-containing protein [Pseudoflavonifractor sp. MSJ-37]
MRTKKRLLSLFTALCLTLGLLPTAAMAATSPATSVRVGGVNLTSGKYLVEGASTATDSAPSSGGYAYFHEGTLELHDFAVTTDAQAIKWSYSESNKTPHLTIQLAGTNDITSTNNSAINGEAGFTDGPCLTITGNGTLNATGKNHAIWVWKNITITGGATVNAKSTSDTEGSICIANNSSAGKITIDNATVKAEGAKYGIGYSNGSSKRNIPAIKSGTVTVSGTAAAFMETPDLSNYTDAHTIKAGADASSTADVTSIGSEKYVSITPGTVDTYTVSGTVKGQSGSGISGATVQLCKAGTSGSSEVKNTITGGDGGYSFTDVAAGTYTVKATKDGYNASSDQNVTVTDSNASVADITLTVADTYNVKVKGTTIDSVNKSDVLNDGGTVSYDPTTGTLTLKDAKIESTTERGIEASEDLTIELSGTNKIDVSSNAVYISSSSGTPKLTITGTGSLTAESDGAMTTLYVKSDITIQGGATVMATQTGTAQAMHATNGTITITGEGTNVTATNSGSDRAILSNVEVKDKATLTATAATGKKAIDGTLTVSADHEVKAGASAAEATVKTDLSNLTECYVNVAPKGTTPTTYTVSITAGGHMTKTTGSGETTQNVSGAIVDVVYTADGGYYFPEGYSVSAVNGISVTRNSYTQITVSGTPTANAAITLMAPTQKIAPAAPTGLAGVGCTTDSNNNGKITGVDTAMEYRKSDDSDWTAVSGDTITGLVPGTYHIRVKATDTALASNAVDVTIDAYVLAYGVWVGATQITSANKDAVLGDSKISYDPSTKTLTLNGANITGAGNRVYTNTIKDACGIYSKHDLTIMVRGENTITGAAGQAYGSYGIFVSGRLTFTNDNTDNKLTITGGTSTNRGNAWVPGIYASSITVNDCHLIVSGGTATNDRSPVSYAMSTVPTLYKAKVVKASKNTDGSAPVVPEDGKISSSYSYKYLEIVRDSTDTTVAAPVIEPDGGYFTDNVTVKISGLTPNSTIKYSFGDTAQLEITPASNTAAPCKDDIELNDTTVIKATAYVGDQPSATVTATFTKRGTDDKPVTGVTLDQYELTKKVHDTATLMATVQPDNATIKDVTWASDNESVVKVDQNGKVTAVAPGKARISVTTKDGGFTACCDVIVEATHLVSFKPNGGTVTPTSMYTKDGKLTDLPTPTRSGYRFDGWFTALTGGTKVTTSTEFSADVTEVYAHWTQNSSGGNTSGGSSRDDDDPTYPVSAPAKTEGGSVTVTPKNASKGSNVTITVDPKDGYALDQIRVTDKNGDTVKLTDKGNGKYSFTMPGGKVDVRVSFVKESRPAKGFTDVPAGSWCYDAVMWAVDEGVTEGVGKGLFAPDMVCTRAQIVTFLWRSAGSPEPKTTSLKFTDVSPDAYYYKAVLWATENGYVSGVSKDEFAPDLPCTRAQAVAILHRIAGSPAVSGGSFADVDAGAYYAGAVSWAVREGITSGVGKDKFGPGAPCTRAQIVTFLYRMDQGR